VGFAWSGFASSILLMGRVFNPDGAATETHNVVVEISHRFWHSEPGFRSWRRGHYGECLPALGA
jgi:hypothetical protein